LTPQIHRVAHRRQRRGAGAQTPLKPSGLEASALRAGGAAARGEIGEIAGQQAMRRLQHRRG